MPPARVTTRAIVPLLPPAQPSHVLSRIQASPARQAVVVPPRETPRVAEAPRTRVEELPIPATNETLPEPRTNTPPPPEPEPSGSWFKRYFFPSSRSY